MSHTPTSLHQQNRLTTQIIHQIIQSSILKSKGRTDKIFCSIKCKSDHYYDTKIATNKATRFVDAILRRNHIILKEIMIQNVSQIKVNRKILKKKGFNFNYITRYYINNRGKTYHCIYDYSYLIFSDNNVVIYRR